MIDLEHCDSFFPVSLPSFLLTELRMNSDDNDGAQYYVGPRCTMGMTIHLQLYSEETCTIKADNAVYEANFGAALPFSSDDDIYVNVSQSLVDIWDCLSCAKQEGRNDNANGYVDYEASEVCQGSVQAAAKCEKNLESADADTSGCQFVDIVFPPYSYYQNDPTHKGPYLIPSKSSSPTAKAFAWIFACSTTLFAAYASFLYRKLKRGSVSLAASVQVY
jgi:hypothetical protein